MTIYTLKDPEFSIPNKPYDGRLTGCGFISQSLCMLCLLHQNLLPSLCIAGPPPLLPELPVHRAPSHHREAASGNTQFENNQSLSHLTSFQDGEDFEEDKTDKLNECYSYESV